MKKFVIVTFFLSFVIALNAQSTRSAGTTAPPPVYQASKKKAKFSFLGIFKKEEAKKPMEASAAFEQRMKAVAKTKRKEARLAEKPENSDPLYFGHKRPPKKRKQGKKKYCKICEFAH